MANPRQRGSQPASKRGDFTGNKKAALIAEHEEEVEARREELGITADRKASIKDEGVIDLTSGKPVLEHPDLDEDDAEKLNVVETEDGQLDVAEKAGESAPQGTRLNSSQGASDMEIFELPEERVSASKQALTADNSDAPTLIKSLYDLEDVTIGYGNTFNFKQDFRYRVPRWVAAHLEEKGVAIVLSLQPA
jgi:hypothetical protein